MTHNFKPGDYIIAKHCEGTEDYVFTKPGTIWIVDSVDADAEPGDDEDIEVRKNDAEKEFLKEEMGQPWPVYSGYFELAPIQKGYIAEIKPSSNSDIKITVKVIDLGKFQDIENGISRSDVVKQNSKILGEVIQGPEIGLQFEFGLENAIAIYKPNEYILQEDDRDLL